MKTKLSISIDQSTANQVRKIASKANKSTSETIQELIHLGCANGWETEPEKIRRCTHELIRTNLGNCLNEYTCNICNYTYTLDSSD